MKQPSSEKQKTNTTRSTFGLGARLPALATLAIGAIGCGAFGLGDDGSSTETPILTGSETSSWCERDQDWPASELGHEGTLNLAAANSGSQAEDAHWLSIEESMLLEAITTTKEMNHVYLRLGVCPEDSLTLDESERKLRAKEVRPAPLNWSAALELQPAPGPTSSDVEVNRQYIVFGSNTGGDTGPITAGSVPKLVGQLELYGSESPNRDDLANVIREYGPQWCMVNMFINGRDARYHVIATTFGDRGKLDIAASLMAPECAENVRRASYDGHAGGRGYEAMCGTLGCDHGCRPCEARGPGWVEARGPGWVEARGPGWVECAPQQQQGDAKGTVPQSELDISELNEMLGQVVRNLASSVGLLIDSTGKQPPAYPSCE